MIYVHPVLVYHGDPPDDCSVPLSALLYCVTSWWETKGEFVGVGALKTVRADDIDVTAENPWLSASALASRLIPINHKALILLTGWDSPTAIGWGADPVALVGDYALSRIYSPNTTPTGLMDDYEAGGLIAHEIGHVLGYGHTTVPSPNIMWEWWHFPNTYAPYSAFDGNGSRLYSSQGTHPCPRPG